MGAGMGELPPPSPSTRAGEEGHGKTKWVDVSREALAQLPQLADSTVEKAFSAWKKVAWRFRLLNQWCEFVEKNHRHDISEETRRQVIAFSWCVHEILEGFDPAGLKSFPGLKKLSLEELDKDDLGSLPTIFPDSSNPNPMMSFKRSRLTSYKTINREDENMENDSMESVDIVVL
ncbi:hypothetical protein TIFTF001_012980 [Ficus carica]|uniref:Uncharacterized protein n=1 Tax=Ficus carica TaxID=3494 RepID=A0AA88D467_FICCA|nr:hypothetical protein TIFTF001_012980 [Ficus carica]